MLPSQIDRDRTRDRTGGTKLQQLTVSWCRNVTKRINVELLTVWHLARTVTGSLVAVRAVAQVDGAVARAADGMSPPADRTRLIHLRLAVLSCTYSTRLSLVVQ